MIGTYLNSFDLMVKENTSDTKHRVQGDSLDGLMVMAMFCMMLHVLRPFCHSFLSVVSFSFLWIL